MSRVEYDWLVSLRIAALGLLAQEPGSGYDLLKHFEKSMANVWPATQSQLYGELNKLADAGLIEVSDIGPRGRKEYRVTDAGHEELRRGGTNPPSRPDTRCWRWQKTPMPRSSDSRSCAIPSSGTAMTACSTGAPRWST